MILKNGLVSVIGFHTGLIILPGMNTVPDAEWNKVKEDATVKTLLAEETFTIVASNPEVLPDKDGKIPPVEKKSDLQLLMELPEAKAIKAAKESGNRKMLNDWVAVETRPAVKEQLEKQIKEIKNIKYRDGNKS